MRVQSEVRNTRKNERGRLFPRFTLPVALDTVLTVQAQKPDVRPGKNGTRGR